VKKVIVAAALSALVMQPAFAGGMAEPVMEPEIIVEETSTGTGGGWVVPLILIALVAAVAAASGSSDTPVPPPVQTFVD
jgi:putative copper export protein